MKKATVYTINGPWFYFGDATYPHNGDLVISQVVSGRQIHAFGESANESGVIREWYIPYEKVGGVLVEPLSLPEPPVVDDVCPAEETTQVDPGVVVDPGQGNQ